MADQPKTNLPIGYWLKKVDEVLTARINEAQEANGLSRTEWQILNFLFENSAATDTQIIDVLQPFADTETIAAAVNRLAQSGFIVAKGQRNSELELTQQGRQIAHTYNEYPGHHNWDYWDAHIAEHLQFHMDAFARYAESEQDS